MTTAVLTFAIFTAAPVRAQVDPPDVPMHPQAPKLDPKACTDRDRLTAGDTVQTDGSGASEENASEKLARTDGVICPPPDLDPQIRAPAPDSQSEMPVIPAPGSPGGNPGVRPK